MKPVAPFAVVLHSLSLLALALLPSCLPPSHDDEAAPGPGSFTDSGTAPEPEPLPAPEPAEWCGYSFDQAVEVFAPERVCQTTVYDKVTGYCTFYEPCSGSFMDAVAAPAQDAGAEPVTTCCRLDNDRGERLDYKCGVAIDASYLEGRGYRCWLVQ